ncbi:MAG: hypothetical protein AB1505_18735 [Candidatus Latescibacterota bacterium]
MGVIAFALLIVVMLMGFALYTALAATFFFSVPLVFREIRRRHREAAASR